MEVKGGTQALIGILHQALPHVRDTGVMNHLAQVKPDPSSHGRKVFFKWQRRDFVLTNNLVVEEFPFGISSSARRISNETTNELMEKLRKNVTPSMQKAPKAKKEKEEKKKEKKEAKTVQPSVNPQAEPIEQAVSEATPAPAEPVAEATTSANVES